jgi:hypothetical protein
MYHTPETLLNHVFEDLRKPKAPNITFLHGGDLSEVLSDLGSLPPSSRGPSRAGVGGARGARPYP